MTPLSPLLMVWPLPSHLCKQLSIRSSLLRSRRLDSPNTGSAGVHLPSQKELVRPICPLFSCGHNDDFLFQRWNAASFSMLGSFLFKVTAASQRVGRGPHKGWPLCKLMGSNPWVGKFARTVRLAEVYRTSGSQLRPGITSLHVSKHRPLLLPAGAHKHGDSIEIEK